MRSVIFVPFGTRTNVGAVANNIGGDTIAGDVNIIVSEFRLLWKPAIATVSLRRRTLYKNAPIKQ